MKGVLLLLVIGFAIAQQNQVVYNGATGKLGSGWLNFSWAKVNLTSTGDVKSGDSYAISMVCAGWQGLYLSQPNPWDVSGYNTFSFWINGGTSASGVDMTVQIVAANNSANLAVSDYLPNHVFTNTWVQVQIPLSHFSLISESIKGFWFQANSANGAVVFFDDIEFTLTKVPPINGPALSVDASTPKTPIDPHIYGVTIFWNGQMEENGGDGTTRYNWMVDSSNSGNDWYFMGGNGQNSSTPGASVDAFITQNMQLGITPTITIPMIQYINKESPYHCSYPKSVYPNQQEYNPYVHPNGDDCGNGLNTTGGKILDKNPLATDVPNTPDTQVNWIQHIVSKFGNSAKSGILYQLDNEVSNWAFMHRDVHPWAVTYQEILYASAVKKADPTATVAAPSEIQFAWYPDWGGLKNVEFFLQQLQAYDKAHGGRLVDTYDAHYPDADDNHWPILKDVDEVRQAIDATYPGTGLSFSEWTMAGVGALGGALAIADQLGHFAKNQVAGLLFGVSAARILWVPFRMACVFTEIMMATVIRYVNSTTASDGTLSIHSALRSSDGVLTILVINKIANDQATTVTINNFSLKASSTVSAYQYSSANLGSITQTTISLSQTGFTTTFVAFSLTLVVIPKA